MNDKKEYFLPFEEVDIIQQQSSPKINGKNIIITINFNNFSNIEIKEIKYGFFKKKIKYILTIYENYLTDGLELKEVNTILEFESKEILDDFINKINVDYKKDVLLNKKTIKNKNIFKELLIFLDSTENTIHRLPYNFNYNEKFIEYKIEPFEKFEDLISKIRESLPEFKYIEIEDYDLLNENGFNLLKVIFNSKEKFRIEI